VSNDCEGAGNNHGEVDSGGELKPEVHWSEEGFHDKSSFGFQQKNLVISVVRYSIENNIYTYKYQGP
jgi:hypothetical protein